MAYPDTSMMNQELATLSLRRFSLSIEMHIYQAEELSWISQRIFAVNVCYVILHCTTVTGLFPLVTGFCNEGKQFLARTASVACRENAPPMLRCYGLDIESFHVRRSNLVEVRARFGLNSHLTLL